MRHEHIVVRHEHMLTFLDFIKTSAQKTVTFSAEEVQRMNEQLGEDVSVLEIGELQEDGSLIVSVGDVIEAAQALSMPGPLDLIEFSKRGYFTIFLDENLLALKVGLEADGFKVISPRSGSDDEEIKHQARGCAILTNNSKDFRDDAARCDYDVIAVEAIKFIDSKPDRTNLTVRKVSGAIRRSQMARKRGNFLLKVHDDGRFVLESLV